MEVEESFDAEAEEDMDKAIERSKESAMDCASSVEWPLARWDDLDDDDDDPE